MNESVFTGVLEDGEETLYNINLKDDEFAKKNVENKKKSVDYKPYDEPQYDEYGMVSVLLVIRTDFWTYSGMKVVRR